MKGIVLSVLILTFTVGIMADVLTCYDVQYTTNTNGNSPYKDQTVTVGAVVSALIPNTGLYLSDPEGGPWSGLYVYGRNAAAALAIGDFVNITGEIMEYSGLTEMSLPDTWEIISSSNPIPEAIDLSTAEVPYNNNISEQWEGVLVSIYDLTVVSTPDTYGQWRVSSGSAQSMIDDVMYRPTSINVGDTWYRISGIVDQHTSAGYKINPRSAQDMVKEDNIDNSQITVSSVANAAIGESHVLNVETTHISQEWNVQSYAMSLQYDANSLEFEDVIIDSTLTLSQPTISHLGTGELKIMYQAAEQMISTSPAVLLKLKFKVKSYGNLEVAITEFMYNDIVLSSLNSGIINVKITENKAHLSISGSVTGKNSFNPSMNEKIKIEYGTKLGFMAKAIVRIYDAQGRLVATPVNKNFNSPTGFENIMWDGRDSNMKRLEPGLYYCHAEISNRETSKRYSTVQPIVIKTRLK
ncbi:MAG: cohesin domain-containing protein [Candidatus Cloacimonetes bacterium]|jgi:hypothetical protein|nr:cohesin domain-containing protein [Candidatus Cloacimonadota bacterium]